MGHEGVKLEKGNNFTDHAELGGDIEGGHELWTDLYSFHQRSKKWQE